MNALDNVFDFELEAPNAAAIHKSMRQHEIKYSSSPIALPLFLQQREQQNATKFTENEFIVLDRKGEEKKWKYLEQLLDHESSPIKRSVEVEVHTCRGKNHSWEIPVYLYANRWWSNDEFQDWKRWHLMPVLLHDLLSQFDFPLISSSPILSPF